MCDMDEEKIKEIIGNYLSDSLSFRAERISGDTICLELWDDESDRLIACTEIDINELS